MDLLEFTKIFQNDPRTVGILGRKKSSVEGLYGSSAAAFYSALFLKTGRTIFIISQDAERLSGDIKAFSDGDHTLYFPSWDTYPTEDISPSNEITGERQKILDRLLSGEKIILTTSIRSAITRVPPKKVFKENAISLSVSDTIDLEQLSKQLVKIGFKRRDIVGERGEFSVRGGIIDIFASNLEHPARIELKVDTIESIRSFESASQRSISALQNIKIFPMHEMILDDPEGYKDGIEIKIPEIYPEFQRPVPIP